MKITYTNAPCNRQSRQAPSVKTVIIMGCVIALMVAVKVFYAPGDSMEDAAAMAGITGETESFSEYTQKDTDAVKESSLKEKEATAENSGVSVKVNGGESTNEEEIGGAQSISVSTKTSSAVFPIRGEITSAFAQREDPFGGGEEEFHRGIDIAPTSDMRIFASMDGEVEVVSEGSSYGNYIKIRHSDILETLYAHCSEIYVSKGEKVSAGQLIAKAGDTGNATGVHLHFEVRINGEFADPMNFLK